MAEEQEQTGAGGDAAQAKAKSANASGKGKGKGKTDAKGKGDAKGKKGKGTANGDGDAGGMSLAAHPRAAHSVARAKAWGGLGGFLLGGYLSLPTHSFVEAGLRALIAGVVCYVVLWAAAVFVWRRLVVAELRHAQHELLSAELAKRGLAEPALLSAGDTRPVAGRR